VQRIEGYSIPEPMTGCQLWMGAVSSGYGQMSGPGGKKLAPHRVMWEAANGRPVPAGMTVDHRCETPLCVNPRHLRLKSRPENTRTARANVAKRNKTACDWGHPFDEFNTRWKANGTRACETCRRRYRRSGGLPQEAPYVPAGWEADAGTFETLAVKLLQAAGAGGLLVSALPMVLTVGESVVGAILEWLEGAGMSRRIGGAVWLTNQGERFVSRVFPATNQDSSR
jgi:hypothetical protein